MGLLKSVDNVPGIDYYEYRDTEYWGKFKYRARTAILGIRYTWGICSIDEWLRRVNNSGSYYSNRRLSPEVREEILTHKDTISKYLEFRREHGGKKNPNVTFRIENNTLAIFSNNLPLLHSLKDLLPDVNIDFTEVQVSQFAGVKYFVSQPKYKFRVYMKSKRVETTTMTEVKELFGRQKELKPSKAFTQWLKSEKTTGLRRMRYLSSTYCIDYNDESTLSYLALMHGDLLGRRYKLEKRP